ncbi:hypothetical protein KC878_01790 [Candidatus Saccharibacteria bacterium]|nr:hypothetical protein [Candidatus Saccharibacteria bacterium]
MAASKPSSTKKTKPKDIKAKKSPKSSKQESKETGVIEPRVLKVQSSVIVASEPTTPEPIPNEPPMLTHQTKSIEGLIGTTEFRQDIASPRLKMPAKSDEPKTVPINVSVADVDHQLSEYYPEEVIPEPDEGQVTEGFDVPLPKIEDDPFEDILEEFDSSSTDQPQIDPLPLASHESRDEVDTLENPKPFDTKHYHAPIKPRLLKTTGTYFLEFFIIVLLIVIFLVILIDANIIDPGFDLPFNML